MCGAFHWQTLHDLCSYLSAGVWRRSVSMAAWDEWRSLMSASPGRSRCRAGVSLRRWSGRWGRRRGNCLHTEQPSPAPLSFRPSWDQPPSSPCSSTSVSCSKECPLDEVRLGVPVLQVCVWVSHVPSIHPTQRVESVAGSPSAAAWADQLSAILEIWGRCFHESKWRYVTLISRMETADSLCQLGQNWGQAVEICMCESQYFYSSERFSKGSCKGKLQHLIFRLGEMISNTSNSMACKGLYMMSMRFRALKG